MTDSVGSYQQFFAELKRRRVFRVMAAYGIIGFGIIEAAEAIFPRVALPDWAVTLVVWLTLLGFPIAVLLAWAFDATPGGMRRTADATPEEISEIIAQPASRHWSAGLLALAGVLLLFGGWWIGQRDLGPDSDSVTTDMAPADVRLALTDLSNDPRPSLAVLPFVNMSADENQEYFSDGITEEIVNVLAKLPELRVAARTSAFAFKGRQVDLRMVGDSLGVGFLIEGSVRKEGDQLRITAQLIDAADGSHLWSDSYDRTLDNVFQIQTEIAEAIAEALRVPLGIDDASRLVTPTTDIEAYDLYLAGRARMRERSAALREANQLFKAAIARDSMWAPAWAGLAESLELTGWYYEAWDEPPTDSATFVIGRDSLWAGAESAARRALELDPNNASANVALGSVLRNDRRWVDSEEAYVRAISVDPDNPEAHQQYAEMLLDVGRIVEGRRAAERAVALDRVPIRILWHARGLIVDGRAENALPVIEAGFDEFPGDPILATVLGEAYAHLGRLLRSGLLRRRPGGRGRCADASLRAIWKL
ncbi:MAG: tetratricopeptide repeat protein [Deltaproteobacteria bacterium]|nr:tetratricopeptide repeat protein [Deltaproteobacteria bacterium]